MRIDIEASGDFKNTIRWIEDTKDKIPRQSLNDLGKSGVDALRARTPRGVTGLTAAGWQYKVQMSRNGAELYWYNNSHPGVSANIARLIQFGHGTGTGGYVPPIDFINPALRPTFGKAADKIAREMFK